MNRETVFEARNSNRTFFKVNKTESGYFTVERPSPHIVAGLVYDFPSSSFVFVKQYRAPVDAYVLELVAGLDDKNPDWHWTERLEQTMKEEVVEETGYNPTHLNYLGKFGKSAGLVNEIDNYFLVTTDGKIGGGGGLASEHENIEVITIKVPQSGPIEAISHLKLALCDRSLENKDEMVSSGIYAVMGLLT
jgi:8-oxo-dGTP pyrophosphatase MutT (NUDIX family)